jgi:hypothetical protein
MLHEDYDRKGTVANKSSDPGSEGVSRQKEVIGGTPVVLK